MTVADYIKFNTSLGDVTIELYTKHAPKTVQGFKQLVQLGYYDATVFHRIITDFMIQGGDPTGTGRGGINILLLVFR
jgi:peptidyl-prolyl cis-trans isomerase-like 1